MTRKCALLDLLVVNNDGVMGEATTGGCLGHSSPKTVKFKNFGDMRKLSAKLLH